MSVWQSEEQRCAVVLREVLAWLAGADVARCGAVCRAWRRAADDPALWRRLLRRESLLPLPRDARWRQEYVRAHAGWRLAARHGAGASVLHGALGAGRGGVRLAVGCADASVAVWARGPRGWVERGRAALRGRGWAAVARVQWPAVGTARLLVAGPLTLVHDWELLVLSVEEDGSLGAVASRVRCSAGAAGCWADALGHTFCSLELRRLGPGLYCTTVWLNAATQETESEYEGVTSPMLRIYNEESQHLTHAVVTRTEPRLLGTGGGRQLVAGGGRRLGAWRVLAPRPARLEASAAGDLAARLGRLRARRAQPEPEEAEPDEAEVRAACAPAVGWCGLPAPLVGLALDERGQCMWAACSDGGAACVSLALQPLVYVRGPLAPPLAPAPAPPHAPAPAHYMQPAAAARLVAWSLGPYSAAVRVCASLTCAAGAVLSHAAPAVGCVLAPAEAPPDLSPDGSPDEPTDLSVELLVLAGEELYARVALGAGRARGLLAPGGGPCGGREVPPCAPCPPTPPPPCRAGEPRPRTALRVVCCPPPQGQRPPCCPPAPPPPLTCRNALNQNRESSKRPNHKDLSRDTFNIGECHQDPVALRLRLAKCAQQAEYELEVAERAQRGAPRAPRATYQLRGQRECARATDGCTYAVLAPSAPAPSRCGPGRSPPPPRCVELAPDDACRIRGDAHLDPCAHRPRTMIEIDRSASAAAPRPTAAARPAAPRAPSVECGGGPAPSWCANPPPPASAPPRCRRPTIVERLQARPPESPNERRIHTSTIFSKAEKCSKSTTGGLENMLRSKQQLKEAGLGRVVVGNEAGRSAQEAPGGRLELAVPAGTRRVAVRVSLEGAAGGPCPSLPAPPLSAPPLSATSSAPVCGNKPSFCTKASTTSVRQDSWLSIKQIQKKLNRCGESSTDIKAVSRSPGRKHGTMAPTALQKAALPTRRCSSTSALLANTVVVGSV